MEISQIYEIIIAAAPAITAIIGIIVSLVVGIQKVKANNKEAIDEMKKTQVKIIEINTQQVQLNEDLRRENAELKRDLRKVMAKLSHIHVEDEK
jgi:predicted ribonuclease toxin of YeeF-YezG toxin-antitoxin module